jgi:hypothetical protein
MKVPIGNLFLPVVSMKRNEFGPVEAFKPAVVWRASQCGWLKVGKTQHGHQVWEKPNGERVVVRAGVEPLVPARQL